MNAVLQATATVADWERFKDAFEWLREQIPSPPPGFISLRIFRDPEDPARVTMLEEWESAAAFQAAFAEYDQSHRGLFLSKAGIDPEAFDRQIWVMSEIEPHLG